jgi:cell shape-determining protein MreD
MDVRLLAAMLFGLMQDFIRTGTFGFPGTCSEAGVGAAE